MNIDLNDRMVLFTGSDTVVTAHAKKALVANGASVIDDTAVPDLLIVSFPLVPCADIQLEPSVAKARSVAQAMGTGSRIVFILSAIAAMPMRRYPEYSTQMAAALAAMRVLAMEHGPKVLVNALGVGLLGEPEEAGDAAMLSHVPQGRAATRDEVIAPLLFLCDPLNSYTTGQILSVDGGWSAGYGRNF